MKVKQNRTLRGLVPICSYCKKTRNSDGCWEQIETYVINSARAGFTHGICPECMVKVEDEIHALNIILPAREKDDNAWPASGRASSVILKATT